MASHAPSLPTGNSQVWHYLRLAVGVILSAAIGGLFAAWFTYVFTARLNGEAALQQQYLASVQDYISTGSKLDAAVTDLADSILDGQEVRSARQEARQALAAHVASTQSLSQVVGEGNSREYMKGLASLRLLIDDTNGSRSALTMSDARFTVMENRDIIVREARSRIYGSANAEMQSRAKS